MKATQEKKRLNKTELVKKVAEQAGIKNKESAAAIDALLGAIKEALIQNKKVTFIGFGTFMTAKRKPRTGINPRTKKKMKIKGKTVAKFKPGKSLKIAIEEK